jgi:PIN domain nuclease of toxin-antitoxin system
VLLDTDTLVWATKAHEQLSRRAAITIADEANEIVVSAASAWEIATKVRLGKMPEAVTLEMEFMEVMEEAGYSLLSVDTQTALRAGRLVGEHRDPFDRMIAAQALAEDIPVISKDAVLDGFGVRRVW